MSQHSEGRLPETEGAQPVSGGARILPFERPQSELQRAIQQRAQEALDLNRERDRETRRPQPLKWLTIFALACIPVLLTIVAIDGFVRVFHKVMDMYSSEPPVQRSQAEPGATEGEAESTSRPGIVMLESYDTPRPAPSSDAAAPAPAADPSPQR